MSHDDRPVGTGRTTYNMNFFDGDNEYESVHEEEERRRDAQRVQRDQRFQSSFQDYVRAFASDAISDEEFERTFTYERLLELDEALERRGGLTATQMGALLKPVRRQGQECSICMEKSTLREKVVVLKCGHGFHTHCLQEWFVGNHTCPNCRHDVLQDLPPEMLVALERRREAEFDE